MSTTLLADSLRSLALTSTHRIVVGVDYGTTYTGVSYVSTKESADISNVVLISSWPGPTRDSETVFKTPSRVAYSEDNPRISKRRWGYQVESGMVAYSWTKLLLDEDTPLTKYDDATLEDASGAGILKLPEGKTAVDVVSDYLSEVYEHIVKTIAKQISVEALSITPLEFWFTVPAIWSDQARSATRTAAKRAGFGSRLGDNMFMISEPEAAAIAALRKYTTGTMGGSVKPGDGVLVCDCGGGTVDITTYLVEKVYPELVFEELCTGIGGKCGSTAIDRNFYQLMSDRFGDAFDNLPMRRKGPGSEFMKRFEIIKRDFGHSDEESVYELPLNMTVEDPNPDHFDEEERLVIINSDDLRSMFDPVVDQILSLVRKQIKDAKEENGRGVINRIILAGGFGDSEYLRRSFRNTLLSTGKLVVTVPDNPQAAIAQGAALRGLEGLRPTAKRCRRHYGFCWSIRFREGYDKECNSYISKFTGIKMVYGIMKWMIAKGEKYEENHTCTVDTSYILEESDEPKYFITLYSCDADSSSERYDDPAVRYVGRIHVDFNNVDLEMFDHKVISGKLLYNLKYKLKVIFGAQEGVLKFEVTSQGQVVGKTSINFSNTKFY